VDVGTNLGFIYDRGILDDPFFSSLLKGNVLRLGGATVSADFVAPRIAPAAVGAFPFKFYEAQ
jgi:hypothetical protein